MGTFHPFPIRCSYIDNKTEWTTADILINSVNDKHKADYLLYHHHHRFALVSSCCFRGHKSLLLLGLCSMCFCINAVYSHTTQLSHAVNASLALILTSSNFIHSCRQIGFPSIPAYILRFIIVVDVLAMCVIQFICYS